MLSTVDEVSKNKNETEGNRLSGIRTLLHFPTFEKLTSRGQGGRFSPLVHSFRLLTNKKKKNERQTKKILRVHRVVTTINIHFKF